MKNLFMKGLLITGGMIALLSGSAMAAYYDNDVTPPWGRLIITGATEVDNSNYEDRKVVEVQVYASDDKCSDNEIKYYLSTSEISDATKITDWKDYSTGLKVNVTLPSTTSLNKIYAVFKDANGNTSLIYSGSNVEQTITYDVNANDATMTTTGLASKRTHGAPFVVTTQTPEREGYFFKGWGLSASDTTPSFYAGDIIPADMSIGTDSTATLYAIWTTEEEGLPKLADVVKVGDYVNYPVFYDNLTYDNYTKTTYTGWRVISKDVDIDGNESVGTVNLVSAGLPLTYYSGNGTSIIEYLAIKFLTTSFHASDFAAYRKTGFNPYQTLTQVFTNKYTDTYANDTSVTYPTYSTNTVTGSKTTGTLKVRAMTKEDILRVTGDTTFSSSINLKNAKYQNLFDIGTYYWLASFYYGNQYYKGPWYVPHYGTVSYYTSTSSGVDYGVRPVVSLKPNVKSNGTDMIGAWNIEI